MALDDLYNLDDNADESLEDQIARLAMQRRQKLAPLYAAQTESPGIGQTLADLAVGLGASFTGGSGPQAIQQAQATRAAQRAQTLKALELEDPTATFLKLAQLKEGRKEKQEAREFKEKESERDRAFKELMAKLQAGQKSAIFESRGEKAKTSRQEKLEDTLRQQYLSNPTTKQTQDVSASYERIQSSIEEPSAAGDLSLIYNFMKMQDPGSTVREGEFATAQNAAGIPDRIRNSYNRLINGERLNPEQRIDFANQARNQFVAQLRSQGRIDEGFKSKAVRNKLDPENILFDFGQSQISALQRARSATQPSGKVTLPSQDEISNEMARRGLR